MVTNQPLPGDRAHPGGKLEERIRALEKAVALNDSGHHQPVRDDDSFYTNFNFTSNHGCSFLHRRSGLDQHGDGSNFNVPSNLMGLISELESKVEKLSLDLQKNKADLHDLKHCQHSKVIIIQGQTFSDFAAFRTYYKTHLPATSSIAGFHAICVDVISLCFRSDQTDFNIINKVSLAEKASKVNKTVEELIYLNSFKMFWPPHMSKSLSKISAVDITLSTGNSRCIPRFAKAKAFDEGKYHDSTRKRMVEDVEEGKERLLFLATSLGSLGFIASKAFAELCKWMHDYYQEL